MPQQKTLVSAPELPLDIAPEAAGMLRGSDLLPGEPKALPVHATYFDTPARDLAAAGFTLSLTEGEDEGERIQTISATGPTADLFVLPEWRQAVAGDRPVLDDRTPVPALLGAKIAEIGPLFGLNVRRQVWSLSWQGAAIDLVLDQGEVAAADRRAARCEIRLLLRDGPPATLYALARRLDEIVPLRLGILTEAKHGFRLLGPLLHMHKAAPVALRRDMTAAEGFRLIGAACLRQFRLNEPLIDPGNPEAVHQARVALRRLRSAFAIFKPMLQDDLADRLKQESRWLAGMLGEARDLDVLRLRCRSDALRARLEPTRMAAYAQSRTALASRRARLLMLDLAEYLAIGPWTTLPSGAEIRDLPLREFAAGALDRFRRKVKKDGIDLADLDDEARHTLRKDAKKLRYAAEFFAPLFTEKRRKRRAARFLAALEALQDRMGALNDLATAPALIARLGLADDPEAAALPGTDRDKRAEIDAAAEAHDAFVDAKRFWR
ncbi:CHAD domain-containing protein [Paracoccus sp. MKU1]|uniref:CYTH and CHAD domain-containing protein n=1 Tax=Paracoccus sp. MKU1 TaxID=1745182 RepID=UPI000719197C|nr:CHAD domain-containing protein [Paracoccus sp. MKU1]KRW93677.1 metal-chelation protein CHAD [Paracoccus sp. MKU1]